MEETRAQTVFVPSVPTTVSGPLSGGLESGSPILDVFERLDKLEAEGIPPDDPVMALIIPERDFVAFASWSDDSTLVSVAEQVLRGERGYVDVVRGGIWERARAWLNDFDRIATDRVTGARLPIAELHTPHLAGCTTTFDATQSGAIDIAISVIGIGGGRKRRVTFGGSLEVEGTCRALTVAVVIEVHLYRHRFTQRLKAICRVVDVDSSIVDEPLAASADHPCGAAYQDTKKRMFLAARYAGHRLNEDYSDVPLAQSASTGSLIKMTLEEGIVYSAGLGFPLGPAPASGGKGNDNPPKLGFKIESTVARKITQTWKLVPGHNYMRFRAERRDMRMYWAWE